MIFNVILDNTGPFIYNARNIDDLNKLKNDVNALVGTLYWSLFLPL